MVADSDVGRSHVSMGKGARRKPGTGTRHPLVIAHRGASAFAPEHTLASYDLAIEAGADYIEQDLQMTRDGVLVVMHDDTLDRTARGSGCRGRVIDRTLDELRDCDVGSWFNERNPRRAQPAFADQRIPALDDVLRRYANRARFYIETKQPESAPGMEEALVALLDVHRLHAPADTTPSLRGTNGLPNVIVQSFSEASLRRIRALAPELPLVQLIRSRTSSRSIRSRIDRVVEYADAIGPGMRSVDGAVIAAAHDRGLAVHPYTVNRDSDMRRLIQLGADGMFTDDPALLVRLRDAPRVS